MLVNGSLCQHFKGKNEKYKHCDNFLRKTVINIFKPHYIIKHFETLIHSMYFRCIFNGKRLTALLNIQ